MHRHIPWLITLALLLSTRLVAQQNATVQGTEYVRSSTFILQGSAEDFQGGTVAPPGPLSPFGTSTVNCADKN